MHKHLTNAQFTAFSWTFFSLLLQTFLLHGIRNSIGGSAVCVNTVRGLAPGLCLFRELAGRLPSNRGNGLMHTSSRSGLFTSPEAVSSAGKNGLGPEPQCGRDVNEWEKPCVRHLPQQQAADSGKG